MNIGSDLNIERGQSMSEMPEVIELELAPIPPDTVASVKEDILPWIEAVLQEADQGELLSSGQIQVEIEKTFPTDAAIIVGITLLSGIALETYKELILPALKRRLKVRQKSRRKKNPKRK